MAKALGLTLPVERGNNGYFNVTTSVLEQVVSSLKNLLLTKLGERPLQPTFGSDLHKFVFEAQTDNGMANLRGTIEVAVKKWMPFVTINDVKTEFDPNHNKMLVKIFFSVKTTTGMTGSISLVF